MKNISEYINQHNTILEKFGGELIKKLALGLPKSMRDFRWRELLMFDKIKDDDIHEITKEEAIKAMRSRKDPGYIIWYDSKRNHTNISWGTDVIATWSGIIKDAKAIHFSYDSDQFYIVDEPERFFRNDLQKQRRNARQDALALKYNYDIAQENKRRYNEMLAQIRRNNNQNTISQNIENSLRLYKEVIDNWLVKYEDQAQYGTPSYTEIMGQLEKMNDIMKTMFSDISWVDCSSNGSTVSEYIKRVDQQAELLKITVSKFLNSTC